MSALDNSIITIDTKNPLCGGILGLGVQWDTQDNGIPAYTDAQWELIYKRLDFMRVKFARVMMQSPLSARTEDSNGIDYNSGIFQKLYRILDYCQSRSVTVMLGEWNKPRGINAYDDPVWINSITDILAYLLDEKRYTWLRYYNFVNEPNGSWTIKTDNWHTWSRGLTALHKTLDERGLLKRISLCGPDSAYADDWVMRCAETLPHIIQDYEYHIYADTKEEIFSGELERRTREIRRALNERTAFSTEKPQWQQRPVWLGELGCKEGVDLASDCQRKVYDFIYGVWMACAVMQVFNGGLHGMIPWDMDDAMHYGGGDSRKTGVLKCWGYWNTLGGQTVPGAESSTYYPPEDCNLRPWYYPMSLFSRFFRQGGCTIQSESTSGDLVTAACFYGTEKSIAILNKRDTPIRAAVHFPSGQGALRKYHYFENDRPTDAEGFPLVKETFDRESISGPLYVDLPGQGLVFLTTLS